MTSPPDTDALFAAALAVRDRAYVPYSGFAVGAAILGADGAIYSGCNVENAAYPEGTCAVADSAHPISPCGGCRQKLAEFAPDDAPVILAGLAGPQVRTTVGALLPAGFAAGHMEGV
jgi:cytidine deaminase